MPGKKTSGTGGSRRRMRNPQGASEPQVARPLDSEVVPSFDPRLMERQMAAMTRLLESHEFTSEEEMNSFLRSALVDGKVPETPPETPLERAQELVYQALEAESERQIELAREALTISPDCADAYVLLAENSPDAATARPFYEQGVLAGERALGTQAFEEFVGDFWGLLETRPYMRARMGLAEVLWELGEREAAQEHARDLLRLNPNDNQGVRYILVNWLLASGYDAELQELLDRYPEEWSATWAYTRALHTFRTSGAGPKADQALAAALEVNPFVPLYLLGLLPLPDEPPQYYGMGDENEALVYLAESADQWLASPESVAWLVETLTRLVPDPGAGKKSRQRKPPETKSRRQRKDKQ